MSDKIDAKGVTIGRLAVLAGVHVETIRYYQHLNLIETPKPSGTYRYYGADSLARLQFIKRAQELGFSLKEIAELLTLNSLSDCDEIRALAKARLL